MNWSVPLLLLATVAPAAASDWSVGASVGTLGLGAQVGYTINDHFAARLAGQAFNYSQDGEEQGINYDGDLKLRTVGVYLDWHPFAGAFRVSGGWFANDNHIDATGKPDAGGTYEIGGATFTDTQVGDLRGDVDFGSSAPDLGVGWLWGIGKGGFSMSLDLGVLFQDSPDIELTSTNGTLSNNPLLQAAIAQEDTDLENDVDQYDLYPALTLGFVYRF